MRRTSQAQPRVRHAERMKGGVCGTRIRLYPSPHYLLASLREFLHGASRDSAGTKVAIVVLSEQTSGGGHKMDTSETNTRDVSRRAGQGSAHPRGRRQARRPPLAAD